MIKTLKKKFAKKSFYPGFLGLFINPFFLTRKELYKYLKKLSPDVSGIILDVGCGNKPYQKLFHYQEYIGIDVAKSGHDHENSEVDVYYDGKIIPFNDQHFDSIITTQVLEHVFEPEPLFKEMNRVLKDNGILLITVPFIWDEHEQPYDFARYSSFGMQYLIRKSGFRMLKNFKTLNNFSVIFQLANCYFHKVLTRRKFLINYLFLSIIITLNNFLGLLFSFILPKNNDLYLDNIILAQKTENV